MVNMSLAGTSQNDANSIKTVPLPPSNKTSKPTRLQRESEKKVDNGALPYYKFNNDRLNVAVIFNHHKYNANPPHQSPGNRDGTHEDAISITRALEDLDFTVKKYDNFTFNKLYAVLQTLSKLDKSAVNCVIVIVMTHGDEGNILWANDIPYSVENLVNPFTGLETKLGGVPKLFFIQACRGNKIDTGVEHDGGGTPVAIPTKADILMMYSTFKGFVAWREGEGSWFIQTLAKQLTDHCEWDLYQILTRVNYLVAYDFQSTTQNSSTNKAKQVSEFTSSLTKNFKFEKSKEDSAERARNKSTFLKTMPA